MNFLNDTQRARFAETNERFGLGPDEFTAKLTDEEMEKLPEKRVMSSTGHTDFPRHVISISSIEEMRAMAGFSDTYEPIKSGEEPDYPSPLSDSDTKKWLSAIQAANSDSLPEEIRARIHEALIAYVVGDPERVRSYVPLINAIHFPGRAAVFTGDVLKVPKGAEHVISGEDPVLLNFGHITVAQGASFNVKTRVFFQSQMFTQE